MESVHEAAAEGDEEALAKYLANGADINARDSFGWTPCHYASDSGGLAALKWLHEKGADINAKGDDGQTPIDVSLNHSIRAFLKANIAAEHDDTK